MAINIYSLTSLDSIKNFMGKVGAKAEDDDLLEGLIDRVSVLFESYCDRKFLSRDYMDYHDGKGVDKLFVNQYPITSISGIWDDREWAWDSTTEIDNSYYRISNNSNYIVFKDTTLLDYDQNLKIVYTAGYSAIPYDLEHACIMEVSRAYKNKNQIDVLSKSLADGSVSFVTSDFLPGTLTILNKYRKISII